MPVSITHKHLSSNTLRRNVIQMAKNGNSVHIGCAFSLIEIFALLYEKYVRLNLSDISDPDRDLVCLSKGHGVMAVYSCLAELNLLDRKHLDKYFSDGSLLKGLSDSHVPGIEVSGGSLGHGVTVAVGRAFAIKQRNQKRNVFCVVGDGEMNEGSVWESLLFAAHWKLDNFFLIVDANEFQAMGLSTEILNCESFADKFKAFNFETFECDGHSRKELDLVFSKALANNNNKPKAIVARTIKGKGVSFMERENSWHYSRLDENSYTLSMKELAE